MSKQKTHRMTIKFMTFILPSAKQFSGVRKPYYVVIAGESWVKVDLIVDANRLFLLKLNKHWYFLISQVFAHLSCND